MATQLDEQRTPDDRSEKAVDDSVKDTFPASDPPAVGGATRIESGSSNGPGSGPEEDKPDENKPEQAQPGKVQPGPEKPGAESDEENDDEDENTGSEAPPNESSSGRNSG
jgi:hypothetical protein